MPTAIIGKVTSWNCARKATLDSLGIYRLVRTGQDEVMQDSSSLQVTSKTMNIEKLASSFLHPYLLLLKFLSIFRRGLIMGLDRQLVKRGDGRYRPQHSDLVTTNDTI